MDKESADVDRVLNELAHKEIVPEEWGGDTPIAKVSALWCVSMSYLISS